MLKRLIKALHELGTVGVMGSFAAVIALIVSAPAVGTSEYAAVRHGIATITHWLMVPSLEVVMLSGLVALMLNEGYMNAGWAWLKALLGVAMFEATLMQVDGTARHAAELAAQVAVGEGNPAKLAEMLRIEWGALWLLMGLAYINLVLAIWRPRFGKGR